MSQVSLYISSLASQIQRNLDLHVMGIFVAFYIGIEISVRQIAPYPKNVQNLKNPKKEYQLYYAEIVSVLHALMSLALVFYLWTSLGLQLNQQNKPQHFYLIAHQTAYFVIDFIFSFIYHYNDLMNNVHHLICIFSVSIVFFMRFSAPEQAVGVFSAEISNPFLQTRNTLRRLGYENNVFYRYLEYAFVFVFLLFRLVLALPTTLVIYSQYNCSRIIQIGCSSLYALSMIWNLQIINKLWKAVKGCLTHDGKEELGAVGKQVEKLVKFIVFSIPGRTIVFGYTFLAYFVLPVWLFILPRL